MKISHFHSFGVQCMVCMHEHPENHQERKRLTRKERRMTNVGTQRDKLRLMKQGAFAKEK